MILCSLRCSERKFFKVAIWLNVIVSGEISFFVKGRIFCRDREIAPFCLGKKIYSKKMRTITAIAAIRTDISIAPRYPFTHCKKE